MISGTDLDTWEAFLGEPVVGVVTGALAVTLIFYLWWKFYRPIRRRGSGEEEEG